MDDPQLPEPDLELGEPSIASPFEWTDDRGQDETDPVVEVRNENAREAIPIPIAKLPHPPLICSPCRGQGLTVRAAGPHPGGGTHAQSPSISPALLAGLVWLAYQPCQEACP